MTKKRIGAAILAFCMVFTMLGSVLPSGIFVANAAELAFAGAENSVTYDFVANLARSGENVRLLTEYDAAKNANWAYHSDQNGSSLLTYYGALRFTASTVQPTYLAFKIKAPAKGKYTMSIAHTLHVGANAADVYILPANTTDVLAALGTATPVGTLNYADASPVTIGEAEFDGADEYLFVLNVSSPNPAAGGAGASGLHIVSLTLDGSVPDTAIPTATVAPGLYQETQIVELECATNGAVIYYTTDESDPVDSNSRKEYTGAITVSETTTIKAVAVKDSYNNSPVATYKYTIRPPMAYAGAENSITYDYSLISGSATVMGNTEYNEATNPNWTYYSSKNAGGVTAYYNLCVRVSGSSSEPNTYAAFKVKAPEKGRYMASFSYAGHVGAEAVEIYILPIETVDIDAALVTAAPVGIANYKYNDGNENRQTVKLGEVEFDEAEEMLLVFKTNKVNTANNNGAGRSGLSITTFELDGQEPSPLESIELALSNTAVSESRPAKASVSGKLADGSTADLRPENLATVTYESDATNVVNVDGDGNITAVAPGKANITVTVSLNGKELSATKEITCVAYGGESTNQVIDLMNGLADDGENVTALTEYNPEKNTNWKYYTNYIKNDSLVTTKGGNVIFKGADADAWSAIKFVTGDAGLYQLQMQYKNHVGAKKTTFYLLSGDVAADAIDGVLKETTPLRTIELETEEGEHISTFGEVALNENTEYILVFSSVIAGTDAAAGLGTVTANKIIFSGVKPGVEIPVISTAAISAPEKLAIGAKATPTVTGTLVSGDPAVIADAVLKFASDNTDVATVDENTGEITAIAGGSANISVTVTLGGKSAEASCKVTVITADENVAYPGSEANVTYDFVGSLTRSGDNVLLLTEYNSAKNTNWAYAAHGGGVKGAASYYGTVRITATGGAGDWIALKLKAPQSGIYNASLTWGQVAAGAKSAYVYLLPGSTNDIADALTTASPIGTVDYLDEEGNSNSSGEKDVKQIDMGELTLTGQTDYYLVLQCKEQNMGTTGVGISTMHINSFKLDGAKPLASLKATLTGGETALSMLPGKTAQLSVSTPATPSEAEQATITYTALNPEIIDVDENGVVSAKTSGVGVIEVTAKLGEYENTITLNIVSGTVKNRRSLYNDQKVANIYENIEKYAWARATRDAAVAEADKYVGKEEQLWNMVTPQSLPRSTYAAYRFDPNYTNCVYCGVNIQSKYGSHPYTADPMNEQWKIQCPDCRRKFPSNDFGSYYKLGITETGDWDPALAKAKNAELVANGEDGYLKNVLYPEMGEGWGVDDGFGWVTGGKYADQSPEVKTFIAYYNAVRLWYAAYSYSGCGTLIAAAESLADAYLYTGEAKYGRTGAILFDRIADVYPEMNTSFPDYRTKYMVYDGGTGRGQVLGRISDYNLGINIAQDYDMLWPAMADEYVISFLSEKAAQYNMENPKTSAELIRINSDNGILREIHDSILDGGIHSNFGHHQRVMAAAAVTLDTMPETAEWIDWIFQAGPALTGPNYDNCQGGNVYNQITDLVDRDGHGNEAAPGYNGGWVTSIVTVADELAGYDKYASADLYKHPKVQRMFLSLIDLTMASRYTPLIGDTGSFAQPMLPTTASNLVTAWYNGLKDENIARMLYLMTNGNLDGLHANIYTKDPEGFREEVLEIVDEDAQLALYSKNITGYGLAILRDGKWIEGDYGMDTQRDFWMYYGNNGGHGHFDKLNLGLHAYGLDFAPDLGNPFAKTVNAERLQWTVVPMSHNTVMVAEKKDGETNYNNNAQRISKISTPLHFDDSGVVKVMDAEAPEAYDSTDIFRRTVVTVNATPEVDYAVDFFRVKGGDDHLYNFHAQSNEVTIEGTEMVAQNGGSYAGENVPFGADPMTIANVWTTPLQYPAGFSWMENVSRSKNPTAKTISADFKINDYFDVLPGDPDLHLKLTMLNDSELSEFAVADTMPPQMPGAPERIKQIVARRQGTNLDSLFTTVIQPYKDDAYIESVEEAEMTVINGIPGKMDAARAVKVTLKSGRIDYVIYATNNGISYKVDDLFEFSGVVGVYSITKDAEGNITPVYTYIHDGTKIAQMETVSEFTGTVVDFTDTAAIDNQIEVSLNSDVAPETLAGKYIYINNDGVENASYLIENAYAGENGNVILDIGEITLIRQYKNSEDINDGFIYNIAEGQSFSIPNSVIENTAPVITPIADKVVEAGSELTFIVDAESPSGRELTYTATTLPRGAQFDSETRRFSWIPDSARLGKNTVVIEVSDGAASASITVEIQVYNATGGTSPSAGVTTPGSMGPGSTTAPDDGKTDEENPDDSGNTGDTDDKTKRFIDLGNHKWAEDAIYRLVDLGVINGTSENTYSPGNAITRADFTTLIVRAFDFTAETTENFSDVESGKYYTDTIAIAKALGIVNGDSKGNFNPMASITRQDMMVIIARAVSVAGIDLSGDVENSFPDMDKVSDYAKDAVELLISSGIIAGSNGLINPLGTTTRAEVAVVLDRLLSVDK